MNTLWWKIKPQEHVWAFEENVKKSQASLNIVFNKINGILIFEEE